MCEASNLEKRFREEMKDLENGPVVELLLEPFEAWVLFSQLQLALRHPGNNGPSRVVAEAVARGLEKALAVSPALVEVAQKGWEGNPTRTLQ